jgi:hypothetical protein
MAGEGHPVLTDDDVQALDRRAREVGDVIGWDLQFVVAPNAKYVGLVAGGGAEHADEIIVLGPSRITDLAVHEARRSSREPSSPTNDTSSPMKQCNTPRLPASIRMHLAASTVNGVPLVRPKSG